MADPTSKFRIGDIVDVISPLLGINGCSGEVVGINTTLHPHLYDIKMGFDGRFYMFSEFEIIKSDKYLPPGSIEILVTQGLTKCSLSGHTFKYYAGLTEVYDYCVDCDEKKPR